MFAAVTPELRHPEKRYGSRPEGFGTLSDRYGSHKKRYGSGSTSQRSRKAAHGKPAEAFQPAGEAIEAVG